MTEDIQSLGARTNWTVDGPVATYTPTPGGWTARVRAVRLPGRSYERWHIAVIDPAGVARYTCYASSLAETARVAEGRGADRPQGGVARRAPRRGHRLVTL